MNNVVYYKYWFLFSFIIFGLTYAMFDIIFPFIVGLIVAYWFRPLFNIINKYFNNRSISSFLVTIAMFILFIAFFGIMIPTLTTGIYNSFSHMHNYIGQYMNNENSFLFSKYIPIKFIKDFNPTYYLTEAATVAVKFLIGLVSFNFNLLTLILIVPFVVFFILRDFEVIKQSILKWVPLSQKGPFTELMTSIDNVMLEYMKGQVLISLILLCYYILALSLISFKKAVIVGIFSGILSFVPYAGCVVGFCVSVVLGLTRDCIMTSVCELFVIYFFGYIIEIYILAPKFSKKLGLHTIWLFFALFAGVQLNGIFGLFVSIPVAITINIIVKYLLHKFQESKLYIEP